MLTVLVVLGVGCQKSGDPASEDLPAASAKPLAEEAQALLQRDDAAGALLRLKKAVKADASIPGIHQLLGQAQLAVGDVVAAEAAYTQALRLGAQRSDVILPLAQALLGQGQPEALLDQSRMDDATLPGPVRAPLLLLKAQAATLLGQPSAAQKFVDSARALNPQQPDSWLAEARVRLLAGDPASAVAAADQALALAPSSAWALLTRADVALALGNRAAARPLLDRAAAAAPPGTNAAHEVRVARLALQLEEGLQPATTAAFETELAAAAKANASDPRMAYLQAHLAAHQGRPDAARSALGDITLTLVRVPPEALRQRPQLLMLGAQAHLALGNIAPARALLEQAQKLPATATSATRLLAQAHLLDNSLDRTITVLEAHVKQHPNDKQAVLMLAGAQLALGRHTRAIGLLQDTQARKDDPRVRGMLAAGHASTGGLQAAQTELSLALKATPAHSGLLATQCALYLSSGQPAKALQVASALVQREPGQPGWQHLLGVAHLRLGQTAAARSAFATAVQADPQFAAARVALARAEAELGQLDAAQAQLQAVLQSDPRHADATFEMGLLQQRRGDAVAAQSWLEKAQAAAEPGDFHAALTLAGVHIQYRRLPAAAAVLRPVAQRHPDDLQVLLAQARLGLANDDTASVKSLLNRATSLAGYETGALVQVAMLQLQIELPAASASAPLLSPTLGARYALQKALDADPQQLAAQALMIDVELRDKEWDVAQTRAQALVASQPRAGLAHVMQGDVALARGQLGPALAAYRRAQDLQPGSDNVLRLHRTLTQTDAAAAKAVLTGWLKIHTNDYAVRRALADSQASAGQYTEARASYEQLLQVQPRDGEVLNNLAHLLWLMKDPGAAAMAEKALAAQPEKAHIMATAGWTQVQAGNLERGMNWLRDARLREPQNPDTRYFLAATLAQMGRKADARTEAQAALDMKRRFIHEQDTRKLLQSLP